MVKTATKEKTRKFKIKKTSTRAKSQTSSHTRYWNILAIISPRKSWPFLAIITAHLIWGANFAVAKLTIQEFPPMSLAFIRFALATILLTPFLLADREKTKISRKDLPALLTIGVLMVTLNIAFFYAGLARTTVTTASVLTMIIPILSVAAGWWFLKEKVYVANVLGIILGLAGAIMVVRLPLFFLGTQLEPQALLGNFLIILASISWVAGAIISKKMSSRYSTLTITAVCFMVGVLTFLIPAVSEYLQNPDWPSKVTYLGILGLLYITLMASISAYFLFEWGLSKLGVIKADIFQYIEPAIATLLGVLILNESLQFAFIFGAILIALGAYWTTVGKAEHKHHKAHRT